MPHVREEAIAAGVVDGRQRRLYVRRRFGSLSGGDDTIDLAIETLGALHDFASDPFIDSQVPFAEVKAEVHERGDRQRDSPPRRCRRQPPCRSRTH